MANISGDLSLICLLDMFIMCLQNSLSALKCSNDIFRKPCDESESGGKQ